MFTNIRYLLKQSLRIVVASIFTGTLFGCVNADCNSAQIQDGNTSNAVASDQKNTHRQKQITIMKANPENEKSNKQLTLTGKIIYQEFEGGFYGFVANNGDKYMPSGLENKYRRNGLIVELKIEAIEDMVTTQQFGKLVKVLEIKVIDASKVTNINQTM